MYHNEVDLSLTLTQRLGNQAHNCKIYYWSNMQKFKTDELASERTPGCKSIKFGWGGGGGGMKGRGKMLDSG